MENDWVKKNLGWIILGVIGILVLIPLGVAFMLSFRFIITDTTNEWIGFWGGYLGSILGGIITLFVLAKTLEEEKKGEEREERIQFFNQIVQLWSLVSQSTNNFGLYVYRCIKDKNNDNVEKIYREKANLLRLILELEILLETRKNVYIVENLSENLSTIRDFSEDITQQFLKAKDINFLNKEQIENLESRIEQFKFAVNQMGNNVKVMVIKNLY